MPNPCPPIDNRSFDEIVDTTESLASTYTDWAPGDQPDLGSTLIRIFGRMAMDVIERINKMPERNFLAFLNLIGVDSIPARASRAALTFRSVEGVTRDVLVPAGTRVAATKLPGERDAVIFETTQDLLVSRAELVSVWAHQPDADKYADCTEVATGARPGFYSAFEAGTAIEHSLYIPADKLVALSGSPEPRVQLQFTTSNGHTIWNQMLTDLMYWNGSSWVSIDLTTNNAFIVGTWVYGFAPLPNVPVEVLGRKGYWLRLRLMTWPGVSIPRICGISITATVTGSGIHPDVAYRGSQLLDMGMDFFPLGEQPRFNDTFYVASTAALGRPGATIKLTVNQSKSPQLKPLTTSDDPKIAWEVWDGQTWQEVGESNKGGVVVTPAGTLANFSDTSKAFTVDQGIVTFNLPATIQPTSMQGVTNYWMRARLIGGNYGNGIVVASGTVTTGSVTNDGYRPPILKSVTLGFTHNYTGTVDTAVTCNGATWTEFSGDRLTSGFAPFERSAETRPALYLGFDRGFSERGMTLYVDVAPVPPNVSISHSDATGTRAEILWEQASSSGWIPIEVQDDTEAFSRSGLLRIIGPVAFALQSGVGSGQAWIRARWSRGEFVTPPRLGRILTNTIWATHTSTVKNEILGSSTQVEGQAFKLAFAPVLAGQKIEVREPSMPLPNEILVIERDEGPDAITVTRDAAGNINEIWVRWHAVPDFQASEPGDRHYTIDRVTGEIRFGDGRYGKLPPRGIKNIRASWYQTGGGAPGNRISGNITDLKTAIPYIDTVTNVHASTGGADAGGADGFMARAPRILRHGNRAVVAQDFEDLACNASPAVARARAVVPTFDPIALGDLAIEEVGAHIQVGQLQLVIVPRSLARCPAPTAGLLRDVESYIRARSSPAVWLVLSGPEWIQVTVTANVTLVSTEGAEEHRKAIIAAINQYLHPLTGGVDGNGWAFGRLPHRSDLYPLLMALDGIDHVRDLTLAYFKPYELPDTETSDVKGEDFNPEKPGTVVMDSVLVFSGIHQIEIHTL